MLVCVLDFPLHWYHMCHRFCSCWLDLDKKDLPATLLMAHISAREQVTLPEWHIIFTATAWKHHQPCWECSATSFRAWTLFSSVPDDCSTLDLELLWTQWKLLLNNSLWTHFILGRYLRQENWDCVTRCPHFCASLIDFELHQCATKVHWKFGHGFYDSGD